MNQLVADKRIGSTAVIRPTSLPRRLPVALMGLIGAATVLAGCLLPWVKTFAGLIGYPGIRGPNGRLLAAAAILTLLVAAWYAARGGARTRTALGVLGFLLAAGTGYLLIQLDRTLGTLAADPMSLSSAGPGLFVCAVGAALVFLTLFLPAVDESAEVAPPRVGTLQWATIVALAVAGAAHIPVIPEHLRAAPYLGVLFILFVIAAWLLAVVLFRHPHQQVWLASTVLCALAIGAYALTRTVALPQAADDVGNWLEPLGIVSVASEAVVVVLGLIALTARGSRRQRTDRTVSASG